MNLYEELERINKRPKPFEYYTTPDFWNDPHISKGMLEAHLDPSHDAASYRHETIDKSVGWMNSHFNISKDTRICDFGCGPGMWTTRFAERGAIVTGVDVSERSLRYARETAQKKNLDIRYILQNYLQFSLDEQFDLITMISRDFPVLSPVQRSVLLQTFHSLLADDGKLILDVDSERYFHDTVENSDYSFSSKGSFWSPGPHFVFSSRFKYEREQLLCDKHTVVESDRQFTVYNWSQCYNIEILEALFLDNGLKIIACYADTAGAPLNEETQAITIIAEKLA